MRKLASVIASLTALAGVGAQSPADAAVGQCFDAYGRPFGPPHNTDNPPYGLICQAYRRGGHCTHVGAGWAESNCGGLRQRPSYQYRNDDDRYRRRYQEHYYR